MTAPDDFLSQFDVQGVPQEKAAALSRARALALAKQQYLAGLEMQSSRPELQELGKAEFGQAGREKLGIHDVAANVFRTALGQKEAEMRLKELQLQGAQLREMITQHGIENLRRDYEAYLSGRHTA